MAVTIRTATLADVAVLREFEQGIIAAERPFDPTLADDPIRYYNIPALIESASAEMVVAEREGRAIGCGHAQIRIAEPYLAHREYAHVGLIYVCPEERGQGVSLLIIAALEAWARSRGIDEVRLEVYADNAAAVRAYEKAGFVQHMIVMRRP
jgi:GNAT superfamily N-acetyltransferase